MRSKTDIEMYLAKIKGELDSASMKKDYDRVIHLMVNSSSAVCDEIDFLCREICTVMKYTNSDECPTCVHLGNGEKFIEELPHGIVKFRQCSYYLIGADLFEKNGSYLLDYQVPGRKYKTFKIPASEPLQIYSPRKALESEIIEYYLDTNFRLYESLESFLQFSIGEVFDMDDSD